MAILSAGSNSCVLHMWKPFLSGPAGRPVDVCYEVYSGVQSEMARISVSATGESSNSSGNLQGHDSIQRLPIVHGLRSVTRNLFDNLDESKCLR